MTSSTNRRKGYIFLDRDGTINKDMGHTHRIEDLEFLPKTISGLKKLQSEGYKFIVVSNQAGVAKKYFKPSDVKKFNAEIALRLNKEGVKIKKFYFCIHHPEVSGKCTCRKPEIGLINKASKELKIKPSESVFVGDKDCDVELGQNCGGKTFLIDSKQYKTKSKPDYKVKNLEEVYKILKD
jgi:D-glycero-D-manno-heptose 1,7-bisphosphate phosphatase